ncbi:MAG TPA: CopD family protein [Burkholderiales bacterium]|nr:CopD family protein [Burkholderiales bacterium]
MDVARFLHVLGAVIWVGGMFFAYIALRPAAAQLLQPPQRLPLWSGTFQRFFFWVWLSVVGILLSGFWMIGLLGGFRSVGIHVHLMLLLGIVMMIIFAHVYFAPYRRLTRQVASEDWQAAGASLAQIRKLVAVNLALGILTVALGTAGRMIG